MQFECFSCCRAFSRPRLFAAVFLAIPGPLSARCSCEPGVFASASAGFSCFHCVTPRAALCCSAERPLRGGPSFRDPRFLRFCFRAFLQLLRLARSVRPASSPLGIFACGLCTGERLLSLPMQQVLGGCFTTLATTRARMPTGRNGINAHTPFLSTGACTRRTARARLRPCWYKTHQWCAFRTRPPASARSSRRVGHPPPPSRGAAPALCCAHGARGALPPRSHLSAPSGFQRRLARTAVSNYTST